MPRITRPSLLVVFEVMLFVYMVVLFLIFIIQFSVSCAALGINKIDETEILKKVMGSVFGYYSLLFSLTL